MLCIGRALNPSDPYVVSMPTPIFSMVLQTRSVDCSSVSAIAVVLPRDTQANVQLPASFRVGRVQAFRIVRIEQFEAGTRLGSLQAWTAVPGQEPTSGCGVDF